MAMTTIYCMQPFWRAGPSKLARGDMRQFLCETAAVMAGEAASRCQAGALVYSVTGNPDFDYWTAPRFVAAIGEVPPISFN